MEDLDLPEYQSLKQSIIDAKKANPDVKFISLIGYHDRSFFFHADSEQVGTRDYSFPGQAYEEVPKEIEAITYRKSPAAFYYSDRWGDFLGGYVPVLYSNGELAAILGIDITRSEQLRNNILLAAIPFVLAVITVLILVLVFDRQKYKEQKQEMSDKLEFISAAEREIASPLGGIRLQIEYLLSQSSLSDDKQKSIKEIYRQCLKVISNVESLLRVFIINESHNKILATENYSLKDLLTNSKNYTSMIASDNNISIVLDDSLSDRLKVTTNKDYFETIFNKLLGNTLETAAAASKVLLSYAPLEHSHQIQITSSSTPLHKDYVDILLSTDNHTASTISMYSKDRFALDLYTAVRTAHILGGNITYNHLAGENTYTVHLPK
jgi:signal transduction histidine kinase